MNRKESIEFNLYKDIDLGISRTYQVIFHESNNDDDFETDEDQIRDSIRYCIYQVSEAIDKDLVPGKLRKKSYVETEESDTDDGNKTLKKP